MASNPINPLVPTYQGYVNSTFDALLLFEACLTGHLNHVPRRPHDRERQDLIQSGNVFIYEEHASGIKRWTDGISWSPSRILGNFLIYRELDEPFPPGEKKRALKKSKHSSGGVNRPDSATRTVAQLPPVGLPVPFEEQEALSKILIGSLVDSYNFKPGGLIKKTISVTVNGVPHHLVSYYSVDDIVKNRLPRPSQDKFFRNIMPRFELLQKQNFRASFEEFNTADGFPYHHRLVGTGQLQGNAVVQSSNSGYMTAYPRSTPTMPQPPVPHAHAHAHAHAQGTANYSSGLQGYLVNGVHAHQMPSQLHIQQQQQQQQPPPPQQQPQQSLSPPQQIPQHHHMQQMQWSYPPASQAPLPGYFSTDSQMSIPNGYFEQEADGHEDIKGEPIDQESWVMGNPSEANTWPSNAPPPSSTSHGSHPGHHSWNGPPGSG